MIVTQKDLYNYSCATQNNGVTQQQIDMFESNLFIFLFGDKAEEFANYIINNKTCTTNPPSVTPSDLPFGGSVTNEETLCTYGDLTVLINGDGKLFQGMRPLIANYIVLEMMSAGKILVSRQNTNVKGTYAQNDLRILEKQQVNGIAIKLSELVLQLKKYLMKDGNNPLKLTILRTFRPVSYMNIESGIGWMQRKGNGASLFGGWWRNFF